MAKRTKTDAGKSNTEESVIVTTAEAAGRTVGRAVVATVSAIEHAVERVRHKQVRPSSAAAKAREIFQRTKNSEAEAAQRVVTMTSR